MAVKLLTVEAVEHVGDGLRVIPAVPMADMTRLPELGGLSSDGPVELRLPDGSRRPTRLVRFGAVVSRLADGTLAVPGDESGPKFEIVFTLSAALAPADVPPGTELWFTVAGTG